MEEERISEQDNYENTEKDDLLVSLETKTNRNEALVEVPDLPRHQPSNPMGLTKKELALRKYQIKELEKLYPRVPKMWLDYIWDYHYSQDKDELEKKIDSGFFEKSPKKRDKKPKQKIENQNIDINASAFGGVCQRHPKPKVFN